MDAATLANLLRERFAMSETAGTTEGTTTEGTTEAPAAAGPTFTQEQVSAIAAKEAKSAKAAAQRELLTSLGVESSDDLKAVLDAHKASVEAGKSAETRAAELAAQLEGFKTKAESASAAVQALLDAEIATIPEDKRSIVPDFGDAAKSLAWITANRALIGTAPAPVVNIGTGAAPGEQGAVSPVTLKDFQAFTPAERVQFHKDFPEQAKQYGSQWL